MTRTCCVFAAAFTLAVGLQADFTCEQTTKITGGAAAAAMKVAGVFSKQARGPHKTTLMVKGDRLVTLTGDSATIIDLAKETFTDVDFAKRTYSVITFAEMKHAMEEAFQKTKPGDANMKITASVKETGQTKVIQGLKARELIMTLEMETTDPKSGQKSAMVVTSDMWLAPSISGYNEIRDFYLRMAKKIDWNPFAGAGMVGAGSQKGMSALATEMAKLEGVPVLQITRMGMKGEPTDDAATQRSGGSQSPATDGTAAETGAAKQSAASAIAGSLGGRLGGFGRRKKPEPKPEERPAAAPPPPTATDATTGAAGAPASLLVAETELSAFASTVDSAKFEVPAGFKQTPSQKLKRMQ